jgi:hypothetical protein
MADMYALLLFIFILAALASWGLISILSFAAPASGRRISPPHLKF